MLVITDRVIIFALFLSFLCGVLFTGKPDLHDLIRFALIDNYIHTVDVVK